MSERLPGDPPPDKTHVLLRLVDSGALYCRGFYFGQGHWTREGEIVRPDEITGWLPNPPTVTLQSEGAPCPDNVEDQPV